MSDDSIEKRDQEPAHLTRHTERQAPGETSREHDELARPSEQTEDRTLRRERPALEANPYEAGSDYLAPQERTPRSYTFSQAATRMLPQDPLLPPLGNRGRLIVTCALAALALFSIFFLGPHFTDPNSYHKTIAALDQKKDTVMTLTGASTGTSAAVTLLPGDIGTPIAEKLVDLSSDFLIVVGALYLEKYLLTILAFIAFYLVLPAGCLAGIAALYHPSYQWKAWLTQAAIRLVVFAVAISVVVPVSVAVSSMIESTYKDSIDQTVEKARKTAEDIKASEKETESKDPISSLVDTVTSGATEAVERVKESLNDFIESLAVMIVTSCVIPIVVLILFIWIMRVLFGIEIPLPSRITHPRSLSKHDHRRR
ncbi:MAG: hypothetical protein Q4B54_14580 [Coriobacteriales bacterium]|nr:hypothetical protein [Coriobacteriales bacterium]